MKINEEKSSDPKFLASFIITFYGIIIVFLLGACVVGYCTSSTQNAFLTFIVGLIIACMFGFVTLWKIIDW